MNHLTESQLSEYIDQMLDESTRKEAENHLAVCDQCRAQFDEIRTIFSALHEMADIPLARDLTPGVLARLPKEPRITALWQQPAFILQSLLTIILLAISLPSLRTWVPQVSAWANKSLLPTMQFPLPSEIVTHFLAFLAQMPQFTFAIPKFSFLLPTTPSLISGLDASVVLFLVSFTGMLWMIGNFSLLRRKPESKE